MRTATLSAIVMIILTAVSLNAAGASSSLPVVELTLEPETIRLGESARMRVTVLVPTWQPEPPVFPSFELPNAITRLPPDSSRPTTRRIAGETWSGIVRNYQVTPLIAAAFKLGGEAIRVTYADPGSSPIVTDVVVPEVTLRVQVPAGAESLSPFLAGKRLELKRSFNRETESLAVGDALVVRYSAVLDGMPAVFIPPLAPALASAMVSTYPAEPELGEGELAERSEAVTLVFDHGGELILPGRSLSWWNTATSSIEITAFEPLTLQIEGPALPIATEASIVAEREARSWRFWLAVLIAVTSGFTVTALLMKGWLPGYLQRRRAAEADARLTESYAFNTLRQSQHLSSIEFYAALLEWLGRLDEDFDLRTFAYQFGDEGLRLEISALTEGLFADGTRTVDLSRLIGGLTQARRRYLEQNDSSGQLSLAPLNP